MGMLLQSIYKRKEYFEDRAEYFAFHHPYVTFVTMFVGMPVLTLLTVGVSAALITLPMSWFFGWL